jgi:hypothetical protein
MTRDCQASDDHEAEIIDFEERTFEVVTEGRKGGAKK